MSKDNIPIIVKRLTIYNEQDATGLGKLMPALNPNNSADPIDAAWLHEIIASRHHDQIVAQHGDTIVGAATLSIIMDPVKGSIGYLEAFVVDSDMQGYGIGNKIWDAITDWCQEKDVVLEFTAKPSRQAAHHFYLKHGAVIRETTAFRYKPH